MKRKNMPARKLIRQLKAMGVDIDSPEAKKQIEEARKIRTKKYRG